MFHKSFFKTSRFAVGKIIKKNLTFSIVRTYITSMEMAETKKMFLYGKSLKHIYKPGFKMVRTVVNEAMASVSMNSKTDSDYDEIFFRLFHCLMSFIFDEEEN